MTQGRGGGRSTFSFVQNQRHFESINGAKESEYKRLVSTLLNLPLRAENLKFNPFSLKTVHMIHRNPDLTIVHYSSRAHKEEFSSYNKPKVSYMCDRLVMRELPTSSMENKDRLTHFINCCLLLVLNLLLFIVLIFS